MPRIVGIDPGLAETGFGIVTGNGFTPEAFVYGVVRTSKNDPLSKRLHMIYTELSSVLENQKPEMMIIEDIFSRSRFPRSAITLGKVSGVILMAGYDAGIEVREIPVREVKQILTGNGNASKKQIEMAVRHFLNSPDPIKPNHASDAIAMALIGLFRKFSNTC
jgi:crossover junction endodeoxyribonuclease RuvC